MLSKWEEFVTQEQTARLLYGRAKAWIIIEYAKIATDDKNVSLENKAARLLNYYKGNECHLQVVKQELSNLLVGEQEYKAYKSFCELYKAKVINEQSQRKYDSYGEQNGN